MTASWISLIQVLRQVHDKVRWLVDVVSRKEPCETGRHEPRETGHAVCVRRTRIFTSSHVQMMEMMDHG